MNKYIKTGLFNILLVIFLLGLNTRLVYAEVNKEIITRDGVKINVIESVNYTEENFNNPISDTYVEQLTSNNDFITMTESELPGAYSSVEKGYISSVKNQGAFGTCWAFGTLAAVEANLIKNKKVVSTIDLSEAQLAYFAYHQPSFSYGNVHKDKMELKNTSDYLGIGGNYYLSSLTFAEGIGIANEETMPYSELSYTSTYEDDLAFESDYIVKNNYYINMSDPVAIKNAVLKYGSVACACYMSDWYLNFTTGAYNQTNELTSNHAIVIVGWDDNYSASNFTTKPSRNGAWLVKNSYSASWGNKGYFWISYEEVSLPMSLGAVFEADVNDGTYLHRYQYDGNPIYAYMVDIPAYGNIYTAQSLEQIVEVGIFTKDNNVNYELEIYTDVVNTPVDGKLVHSQKGTIDLQGYHTIELNEVVNVDKGTKFSVVIRTTDENGEYVDIMVDMTSDFDCTYNYNSVSNLKESFVYSQWYKCWTDLATKDNDKEGYNCRIKVLTKKCEFDFDVDDTNNYKINKLARISSNVDISGAKYKYEIYNKDAKETVTIDYSNATYYDWTPTKAGQYTITVAMKDQENVLGKGVGHEYILSKNITIGTNIGINLAVTVNYDYNNYKVVFSPQVTESIGRKKYTYIVKNTSGAVVCEESNVTADNYYWKPSVGGTYTVYCTVEDDVNNISTYKKVIVPILSNCNMNVITTWTNNKFQVTINANSANGAGVTQYCYTIKNAKGVAVATRAYTIQKQFVCNLTSAGTYYVECMVKDSLGTYKKLTQTIVVSGLSNIKTSISSKRVSNKPVITITSSAAGGYGTKQYYYRIKKSNGTVVATRNYTTSAKYEWYPTSGGTYYIESYVKDALGSTINKTSTCSVASMTLKSISVSKKNESKGLRLQIKPSVTNNIGSVTYYYQVKKSSKVMATKNYGTATSYNYYPKSTGTYTIICKAKDSKGNVVTKQTTYKVTKSTVKVKKISYSKKKSGKKYKITIKPSASGGYGTKSYQYQILNSKGKVVTKKAYTMSTKITLNVSKKGTYYIRVYAKDKLGTTASKKIKVKI